MAQSGKLKDTDHYKDGAGKRHAKGNAVRQGKVAFEDKTFAQLTGPEKDELLKIMAIRLGMIEE